MQFLKRHFEKIILSAVLAGLGAAAFWLSMAVKEARRRPPIGYRQPAPAKPLPEWKAIWRRCARALANMTNAPAFELSGEHNLFNPVTWKMKRNGELFKMTQAGRGRPWR